ncbi:AI-2E family transporter [Bremerella sp. T1]|uniref:AI-2E family transporter n=1 Tax=Bremerella sp. TYQ1 TaxID=3119568 RepID=UPI001CCB749A|nr:AI-2E family transporter [Bremerella volcania]UBM35831.1 AI-2E family transporter [Bremerella volcania]
MSRFDVIETDIRRQTICLAIGVGVLALWTLYWLQSVLIPFVMAIFIVSGLTPVLSGIQDRLSTTRLVAVLIASMIGFALVFVLWSIIWVSVAQLREDGKKYVEGAKAWQAWIPEFVMKPELAMQSITSWSNSSTDTAQNGSEPDVEGAAVQEAGSLEQQTSQKDGFSEFIHNFSTAALQHMVGWTWYLLQTGTMVVIFLFFLLLGSSDATLPEDTWKEIDQKIREYILTKSLISFFTGLAFGFVLWLFGIPLAAVFALLAFLFNFIPNIGPIFACLLPLPLILLDPEMALWKMVLVISLSSAVQIISGNVIEPRMMGDSFDVHPIAILLALMFWSLVWGMIGMFLAVPMTAVMKILFAKFEMTKPLADLLAGRIDGLSMQSFNFSSGDSPDSASAEAQA